MAIKRKLKNKSGFTLAETLLAVLILLLVSVIVANGIPVARNVYNNVIIGANAQMLLSTAVTALRNELGTARDVNPSSDNTYVTYFNAERGAYSAINKAAAPEKIQVNPYIVKPTGSTITSISGSDYTDLVSNAASNKYLFVTYKTVELDGSNPDIIVFSNIEVKSINDPDSVVTSLDELIIRLGPDVGSVA